MIEFACESCGRLLTAPDGSYGKKGRCRHCGQIVVIRKQIGASLEVELESLGEEPDEGPLERAENRLPPIDFRPLLVVLIGAPILAGVGLAADPTGQLRAGFLRSAEWSENHGVGYWIIGIGFVALAVRMIYALWSWALDTSAVKKDVFAVEQASWAWFVESVHYSRKAAKDRARARASRKERERTHALQAERHARELEAAAKAEAANPLINCRDCGATVSKRAAACPNCGAPLMAQATQSVHIQQGRPIHVSVRQQVVAAPRRGGDALGCGCCFVLLGLLFCCLFWPLGLLFLVIGFVLVLVSLFV